MSSINAYATLADYKAYILESGQSVSTDSADDAVIESLLDMASRYFDEGTGRFFFPLVVTNYYDTPASRLLELDFDLCEIISITNGDGTTLPSTEYILHPRNLYPARGIKILDTSTYSWQVNTVNGTESAITVVAIASYRDKYSTFGWKTGTTLAEDLDVSETEWDVTSSSLFSAGQIIRCGNELGIVSSIATGKVNVSSRGDNGSTAAVHSSGVTVYIWQPMEVVKNACLQIAHNAYKRRSGQGETSATITAAGVVLVPQDIPANASAIINGFRKIT